MMGELALFAINTAGAIASALAFVAVCGFVVIAAHEILRG